MSRGWKRGWQAPVAEAFGSKQEPVEIECKIIRDNDRDNAILIQDGSTVERVDQETGEITEHPREIWIPRSHLRRIERGKNGISTITVSEWIAGKEGLI